MKKIYRYFALLVIGLSFIFYGIIEASIEEGQIQELTDAEIIEKAKELGMIELNEYYLNKEKEKENE